MTSPEKLCVKIALWGEFEWDNVKLFETVSLLPKYLSPRINYPPVANNPAVAAQQDFFRELSMCHTVENLFQVIRLLRDVPRHNPAHYRISEVSITKRRLLIQHEGIMLRAHHQSLPEDQSFFIFIDRDINFYRLLGSFYSSRKDTTTNHVDCCLTHTRSSTVIWRTAPNDSYTFSLLEIAPLLNILGNGNRKHRRNFHSLLQNTRTTRWHILLYPRANSFNESILPDISSSARYVQT
ncbi:hypothetical protein F5887DRAFT_64985 [Amanita rubescens]|nr:hypothetical protein F5887DRAFT_64985 [Amanita rubescens]